MRAFLREPSTPWIVFDREGRPPSQLAVGEMLPVAMTSVIVDHGFFPATAIIDAAAAASKVEPSSLAVVSDLEEEAPSAPAARLSSSDLPARARGRRMVGAGVAGLALLACLGVGMVKVGNASRADLRSAAAARPSPRTFGAPVPADLPPPDLDALAVPVAKENPPAPATSPASSARAETAVRTGPNKLGKLSIRGEARWHDVFMDGKRLLGHGARSFTVFCGEHTIGIDSRTDVREVEVPCNAELVIRK